MNENRTVYATRHDAVIFLSDARQDVARPVKINFKKKNWEFNLLNSPGLDTSDYNLFEKIQNALTEKRFTTEQGIRK